jgi:hypothetical protein
MNQNSLWREKVGEESIEKNCEKAERERERERIDILLFHMKGAKMCPLYSEGISLLFTFCFSPLTK